MQLFLPSNLLSSANVTLSDGFTAIEDDEFTPGTSAVVSVPKSISLPEKKFVL